MPSFNPAKDVPPLTDKVILVTGATSGLGEASATAYALHRPARLILAARSRTRAEATLARITSLLREEKEKKEGSTDDKDNEDTSFIEILELDLASLASVRRAAEQVLATQTRLDIVQLNGGIGATPPATTVDGYEVQFGTNYLGHAALVQMLMPLLLKTTATVAPPSPLPGQLAGKGDSGEVRLVLVSSVSHKVFAPSEGIPFDMLKTPCADGGRRSGLTRYGSAMLAKNLFADQLMRRYGGRGIHATSVHPGTVRTAVWDGEKDANWFLKLVFKILVALTAVTPEDGAKNQLWASVSKDAVNGKYYEPVGKAGMESKLSYDQRLGNILWSWTNAELKGHGFKGWIE